MSLREDMWKYEQITGESAEHVPIIKLGAFLDGYETGLKALEQQPKRGKWIEHEDNTSFVHQMPTIWIECSCCGWSFDRGYKNRFLYCPKCGADMRGDSK